jgi:hypothetical protein
MPRLRLLLEAELPADPDLFRAATEYVGTITPLPELFRRPTVAGRVREVRESLAGAPPFRLHGLGREAPRDPRLTAFTPPATPV